MNLPSVLPMCGICRVQDATQQVETNSHAMLLACSSCALPCRQAAHIGLSVADIQEAAANGHLHSLALRHPMLYATDLIHPGKGCWPAALAHAAAAQSHASGVSGWQQRPLHGPGMGAQRPAIPVCPGYADVGGKWPRVNTPMRCGPSPEKVPPGHVPPGYKMCNLCCEVLPTSGFPASGERVKPYCHSCMPPVRRGIQLGMKVASLRESFQVGGIQAVHDMIRNWFP
jgi:hypothetical protein